MCIPVASVRAMRDLTTSQLAVHVIVVDSFVWLYTYSKGSISTRRSSHSDCAVPIHHSAYVNTF